LRIWARPAAARRTPQPTKNAPPSQVANSALDRADDGPVATWELLQQHLARPSPTERLASLLARAPCLRPAAEALARPDAARRLLLVSALVRAHLAANQLARKYLGEVSKSGDCADDDEEEQPDPEVVAAAAQVVRESAAVVAAAGAFAREQLVPRDRKLAALLQSRLAALQVLEEQHEFLERIEDAGELDWGFLRGLSAGEGREASMCKGEGFGLPGQTQNRTLSDLFVCVPQGLIVGEEIKAIQGELQTKLERLLRSVEWHPVRMVPREQMVGAKPRRWLPRRRGEATPETDRSSEMAAPPAGRRAASVPSSAAAAAARAAAADTGSSVCADDGRVRRLRTYTASFRVRPTAFAGPVSRLGRTSAPLVPSTLEG
jgi:hypothetical protein